MAGSTDLADPRLNKITTKEIDEAQKVISSEGMSAFTEFMKQKLDDWKGVTLNVGFIGNSGVGKSSIINSILGLSPGECGAAEVGTRGTTSKPTPYVHPSNDKVIMWDLPGVGTPNYPRSNYFEQIMFDRYDFFLLLGAVRFREEDAWIGKEITKLGKDYFYVRTKIDNDIDNNRADKKWDRDQTMTDVRSDIEENMKEQEMDNDRIYLVSNRHLTEYDFPRLLVDLVESLPDHKKGALTLSLRVLSVDIIHMKVGELKKGVALVATASATATIIPIPGAGIAADVALLLGQISFYYEQLGLAETELQRLGRATGTNPADLIKVAGRLYPASFLTSQCIKQTLFRVPAVAVGTAVEELSKYVPIIGTAIAAGVSFGTMAWFLNNTLNKMEKAATEVLNEALKKPVSN